MSDQLSTIIEDAQWRLCNIDPNSRSFQFIHTPREVLKSNNFADQHYTENPSAAKLISIPFDEIEKAINTDDLDNKCHYIFHSAFCGSTLLSKSLDYEGNSVGIREPHVLFQLSTMKRANPLVAAQSAEWMKMFKLAFYFLSRPYNDGEITLIKPSNAMNNLIPELLNISKSNKSLFLFSTLKEFLISNLKKGLEYETFVNSSLEVLYSNYVPSDHDEQINEVDPFKISPLRRAALLWVVQMAQFQFYFKHLPDERKSKLSFSEFISEPEKTLTEYNQFFQLGFGEDTVNNIAHSELFSKHAKGEKADYNLEMKKEEDNKIIEQNRQQIEETLEWVKTQFPNMSQSNPL